MPVSWPISPKTKGHAEAKVEAKSAMPEEGLESFHFDEHVTLTVECPVQL
jgi:hypothetical protein